MHKSPDLLDALTLPKGTAGDGRHVGLRSRAHKLRDSMVPSQHRTHHL
jgi:hypothetical protein